LHRLESKKCNVNQVQQQLNKY